MIPTAVAQAEINPPQVETGADTPVRVVTPDQLKQLGAHLLALFGQYKSDRKVAEDRWLRNQRQYLGVYDPEILKELGEGRSDAYPRITRVKCISTLSRLMNLMFQGNEKNWEIKASASADMTVDDVEKAIADAVERDQKAGVQRPIDEEFIDAAVQTLAEQRAKQVSTTIEDQMQELGGSQTLDYVTLNRKVVLSGIMYGLGLLRGPFQREVKRAIWSVDPITKKPIVRNKTIYKPVYEFLSVWDFYPDMSAKQLGNASADGYFIRLVMTRSQLRKLGDRSDFFESQIKEFIKRFPQGNYKPLTHETELRNMGVKENVNDQKGETGKYEVVIWNGACSGEMLKQAGVPVPDEKVADDLDSEVWMIDGNVIKADLQPWAEIGAEVEMLHAFVFDEDDTSPVGAGLPNVIRDSQMSICSATRMLLDNASVTCGPQLELNTALLRPDQDLQKVEPYKVWYRDDDGPTAQWPAVRAVQVDSHMDELLKAIDLFIKFADAETFVGPATGGDMERAPSEPMRTAAGASMLRGDAALPFKDIVRQYDAFTMSVINSMLNFNRALNKSLFPAADYDVLARGATSLIAKEVRAMQIDQVAATLRPEQVPHVDERKLVEAQFAVRDLTNLLVSPEDAARRKAAADQQQAEMQQIMQEKAQAEIRKIMADAFKGITQGQKNAAAADAEKINTALTVLMKGLEDANAEGGQGGAPEGAAPAPGNAPAGQAGGMAPMGAGAGPEQLGGQPSVGLPAISGGGAGL